VVANFKKLSPPARTALDAARAAAAIYVVFYHLDGLQHWPQPWGLLFGFGQEAVLVFFVLSGFVIFANERDRLSPPYGYFLRRLRRIYPPLLVAMGVSALVAADNGTLAADFRWSDLLATLFSVEDISRIKPGVIADPFLNNEPLWSLSYEMAFYLAFPAVMAAWRRSPKWTNHAIGASACAAYLSCAAWPNHWSLIIAYFPCWWIGAMVADAYFKGARRVPILWLVALCAVASAVAAMDRSGARIGLYPMLPLRHFATAALLVLALFGPLGRFIAHRLRPWPWAWLASISYGIYVLHYPLLVQWRRVDSVGGFCLAVVLLVAGATLVDRALTQAFRSSRN
jgi:peptidoglycan/LPS O-acetylase OafA/YrhL